MNKQTSKYGKKDNISYIQNNLKEMKEEVNHYLKRTHQETVPPILRARNYLILSYIHDLHSNKSASAEKTNKSLNSEIILNKEKIVPLPQLRSQKSENNQTNQKLVPKRSQSECKNGSSKIESLFPYICHIKLDLQDKSIIKKRVNKNILQGKSMQMNRENYDNLAKVKRYLSIQLNELKTKSKQIKNPEKIHQSIFEEKSSNFSAPKMIDSRQFNSTQALKSSQSEEKHKMQEYLINRMQQKIQLTPKLVSLQRKQSIRVRRNAVPKLQSLVKPQQKPVQNRQLTKVQRDSLKINPNLYCPWQQVNTYDQESLYLQRSSIF